MTFHRLSWRVGLPFVLLVLIATVALAAFLGSRIAAEESDRLARVAEANAAFIETSSLTTSEALATQIQRVSGYEVFFRINGVVLPRLPANLAPVPLADVRADGVARAFGDHEAIAIPVQGKHDLLMVRQLSSHWLHPRVLAVLAAFVLLAAATAWVIVRSLVQPLRQLAAGLPDIERPGRIDLPAARRNDELGDLARSFLRTRQALHDEQAARQRAEKLAVLGRMTAALAHEVQNPVAAIRMHAQLWQRGQQDGTAATIQHEAARIEGMLNQWLFLTRPEPPALAPLDLGALLAATVAAHRPQTEHAAVRVTLAVDGPLIVEADGRRLEQVFRNLITNAVQAMPGGGTLTITARRSADRFRITFQDTGPGFSATARERFAEFFYSEREGGMGIGLGVASEIVKAHGGALLVENAQLGGALVTLELPAVAAAAARPCAVAP